MRPLPLPPRDATLLAALALLLGSSSAAALDKRVAGQGCAGAHDNCGSVFAGPFLLSDNYGAAPDNTGLVAMRMGIHVDQNLFHRFLGFTFDLNSYSDRDADHWVAPSEIDLIAGFFSEPLPWLELAMHFERDGAVGAGARTSLADASGLRSPATRSSFAQTYLDLDARASTAFEWRGRTLRLGAGLSLFAYNPSYAARPDLSGLALFRYPLREQLDLVPDWLSLRLDQIWFTDRCAGAPSMLVPSELDLVVELGLRPTAAKGLGVAIAYERDLSLGGTPSPGCGAAAAGARAAQYLSLLLSWQWSVSSRN